MLDKRHKRMTPEEFYAWQEPMDEKYELVDGSPVKMMTGASRRHDQIVVNMLAEFQRQLRGTDCRPFTADTAVATRPRTRRRPDVGVECGPFQDREYVANEPRLVVEVLSPSTRESDLYNKIEEYRGLDSLDFVLFVDQDVPHIVFWARNANRTWSYRVVEGLESTFDIAEIGLVVRLADVYEDLVFRSSPKLVDDGGSQG